MTPKRPRIPLVPAINRSGPRLTRTEAHRFWDLFEEILALHGQKARAQHTPEKEKSPEVRRLFRLLQAPQEAQQAPEARVLVEAQRCLRCAYVWVSKQPPPTLPRRCPRCKSARWFYPERYSREFWAKWKDQRRELWLKEEEWVEKLSRSGIQEMQLAVLKGLELEARTAMVQERGRRRRWGYWEGSAVRKRRNRTDKAHPDAGPALGCACVPGHQGGERRACDVEGCPCRGRGECREAPPSGEGE